MKNKLFILCGPRAIGGTYLIEKIVGEYPRVFREISSTTTRPPRPNNPNDARHYRFLTKNGFIARHENGEFLEYDFHQNDYYGTRVSDLENVLCASHGIMKMTPKGACTIANSVGLHFQSFVIFLEPQNDDILVRNMNRRFGTAKTKEQYKNELLRAYDFLFEMKRLLVPDYTIAMTGTSQDVKFLKAFMRGESIALD